MKLLNASWLACRPIAHRGLHNEKCPENSLPAFISAMDCNYPIELDVQLCKDNVVVVFHDYNTFRMTGISRKIADIKSTELVNYQLDKTKYHIPTFEQVLEVVKGRVPLLIEIKNEGKAGALEEEVCKCLENYCGEFAIQSFNPLSIRGVRKINKDFIVGLLSKDFNNIFKKYCYLILSNPDFIAYKLNDMPSKMIKKAKSKGAIICCWTITNEYERKKAAKYCTNYIFENIRP